MPAEFTKNSETAHSNDTIFESGRLMHSWGERFKLEIDGLTVEHESSYAILGANGSGKSTLLRLMAEKMLGSEQYSEPGIVGYLPQNPYSFRMTVAESIRLGISPACNMTHTEQNAAVYKSMEMLGLKHLKDAQAHKLSGGEAQRVALARLMTMRRQVLLLDEPTASLDLNGLVLAERAISEYLRTTGCMLMLVTHQISLAERLCDKIIFLNDGRIDAEGPLKETLQAAAAESLRQFLHFEKSEFACELY